MKTFGMRIKALRIERGESQAQAASALGITRQLISQYETGQGARDNPKLRTIQAFAAHYGVSAGFLIGDENSA